jgi:hypothetical protein
MQISLSFIHSLHYDIIWLKLKRVELCWWPNSKSIWPQNIGSSPPFQSRETQIDFKYTARFTGSRILGCSGYADTYCGCIFAFRPRLILFRSHYYNIIDERGILLAFERARFLCEATMRIPLVWYSIRTRSTDEQFVRVRTDAVNEILNWTSIIFFCLRFCIRCIFAAFFRKRKYDD